MKAHIVCLLSLVLSGSPVLAAVNCSLLTQGQDATNASSFATASVTPGSNRLVLLATHATRSAGSACAGAPMTGVTGNGLTWVSVASRCFSDAGAPTQIMEVWRSMGASPSAGAVTMTYSASRLNAVWVLIECNGVDTGGTNGSGAIVQSVTNLVEPGTSLTVTLAAFGSANNVTFGAFGLSNDLTITPGSGFTELGEQTMTDGGNDTALQVEWLAGNDTSVDASFSSADAGGIAIEIKAGAVTETNGEVIWFY